MHRHVVADYQRRCRPPPLESIQHDSTSLIEPSSREPASGDLTCDTLSRLVLHLRLLCWLILASRPDAEFDDRCQRVIALNSKLPWPPDMLELLGEEFVEPLRHKLGAYSFGGQAEFYFHETIAKACDRARRRSLGAYYTPIPIVRCIAERVDRLLPECNRASTIVLDPCCGSGLFPQEAASRWPQAIVRGLELDSGSAASAGLLLDSGIRVGCANALGLSAPELHKAIDVEVDVERLVILGNPPYANFGRRNAFPWLDKLLQRYKEGLGEKKHNLNDDFIKFLCWAQHQVEEVGEGMVAFVLNNSFLDSITRRILRRSLLRSFDRIEVINLHGGVSKRETVGAIPDENVFGIRQGVAILVLHRHRQAIDLASPRTGRLFYQAVRGARREKLERLADVHDSDWIELAPSEPSFLFSPSETAGASTSVARGATESLSTIETAVEQYSSGVQTKCDKLFVDSCPATLRKRMQQWLAGREVDVLANVPDWLQRKREAASFRADLVRPYMTAPLDVRYVYYDPALLGRARLDVMRHMLGEAETGLAFMRQSTNPGTYDHFLAVNCLVSDRLFYSAHGAPFLAPFRINGSRNNLRACWLETRWWDDQNVVANDSDDFWPYYYALFHSNSYREDYEHALRTHFCPLPPPIGGSAFEEMVELGRRLMSAHLDGSETVSRSAPWTSADPSAALHECVAARPAYDREAGAIRVNSSTSISAPEGVLDWRIGGYRVIHRWLSQRRGRPFDAGCRKELLLRIRCFETTMEIVREIDSICRSDKRGRRSMSFSDACGQRSDNERE